MLNQVIVVGVVEDIKGEEITLRINPTANNGEVVRMQVDVSGVNSYSKEFIDEGVVLGVKTSIPNSGAYVAEKVTFIKSEE